jgi:signal transduction histidine kinase
MCHEIRNPLNAVLGFAQLLAADQASPLNSRQRQQLQAIDEAAHHILHLLDDALHAARPDKKARPSAGQDVVDVGKTVAEVVRWMEPAAADAGVALAAQCAPLRVRGDAQYLREVLINLVSNAIKYNRPGGRVNVSAGAADDAALVVLAVRDTGPGLDEASLARLFHPYERLGAEDRGVEGTGLGLCITRQLVERMGATMDVSSRVGEGTVFVVKMPAA